MDLNNLIKAAEKKFEINSIPTTYAKKLMAFCLGFSSSQLMASLSNNCTRKIKNKFNANTKKMLNGTPFEYITKRYYIDDLKFNITPNVLIPRDETIELIQYLVKIVLPSHKVLDLCTGSGIIGIYLQKRLNCDATLVDISRRALRITRKNIRDNSVDASVIKSNLFNNLNNMKFDVIVCNPPYVSLNDKKLSKNVWKNEPKIALIAKNNGLEIIENILKNYSKHVNIKHLIAIEFGIDQKEAINNICVQNNINNFNFISDINHVERFLIINNL